MEFEQAKEAALLMGGKQTRAFKSRITALASNFALWKIAAKSIF